MHKMSWCASDYVCGHSILLCALCESVHTFSDVILLGIWADANVSTRMNVRCRLEAGRGGWTLDALDALEF
jgi:hypothetical protein